MKITKKQSPNNSVGRVSDALSPKGLTETEVAGSNPASDNLHKKQQDLEKDKMKIQDEIEKLMNSAFEMGNIIGIDEGITFAKEEILKEIDEAIKKAKECRQHTCKFQLYNPDEDICLACFEAQAYKELKEKIK